MSAQLEIFLLGRLSVRLDGQACADFVSRKELALLAYLAYTGRPQPRDWLAEMLWTGRPAAQSQANLRTVLTNLRRQFDPFLLTNGSTLALRPGSYWLDTDEFCRRLGAARLPTTAGAPARAAGLLLAQALTLYQGDFLGPFDLRQAEGFEEWAAVERSELRHLALVGLRDLSAFYAARGRLTEALPVTRRWLQIDPLDEGGHRALLRLLAQNDQRNAALQHYGQLRRLLAHELAAEPEAATHTLAADIRAGRGAPASRPAPPPAGQPAYFTPFVGRAPELAQLQAWLADPTVRLITLYGLGGSGKTRLALEALRLAEPDFFHGAGFVALAAVATPAQFLPALADALGLELHSRRAAFDQVRDYLRERELLLVLDNLEQLLTPAAGEIGERLVQLLQACPRLVVLVTSRARLNLRLERALLLEGLPLPPSDDDPAAAGYPSVALYLANSGLEPTDAVRPRPDLRAIVRLCRVCAGLPLAIELAAMQAMWHSPAALADELCADLSRLDAATADLPAPHRSLRAVFERSWELLAPAEQARLARLAVFDGGFSPEAAAAVSGAGPADLAALAYKTALRLDPAGRYDLHPLVHQHVAEKLAARAAEAEAAERQSAYYLALLAKRQPALFGPQPFEAVAELRGELPNLRRAWAWAARHRQAAALLAALDPLERFLALGGHQREAGELALAASTAAPGLVGGRCLRSLCLSVAALAQRTFGLWEESRRLAQAALAEAAGNAEAQLRAHLALAELYIDAGRASRTREHALAALALAEAAANPYWQLLSLRLLRHEETGTTAYLERALGLAAELGDHWMETTLTVTLGGSHMHAGRYAEARSAWQRGLARAETLGNARLLASCHNNLGDAHQLLGDYAAALAAYEAALALARAQGDRQQEAGTLEGAARTALLMGRPEQARDTAQAGLRILGSGAQGFTPVFLHGLAGHAARALGRSAEAAQAYTAAIARATAERQLEAAAESHTGLAALALARGDLPAALAEVELVLAQWAAQPPDGYPSPRPMLEICVAVLRAAGDPRAAELTAAPPRWKTDRLGRNVSLAAQ